MERTPRLFTPFLMWTRGGVKTGYFFLSPSSLSFVFIFCCLDQRICNGSSIYDHLIKRVLLCSVFSETLDVSWIWTFPKTSWVNFQNFKWPTTWSDKFTLIVYYIVLYFIYCVSFVKTAHYVSQSWVKELIYIVFFFLVDNNSRYINSGQASL